jgi:hypothetical protein
MFTDNAEQARREWEPVFPDTPDHESEIAQRIRSALIEVSGERGYEETTLEAVLDRAGIGRVSETPTPTPGCLLPGGGCAEAGFGVVSAGSSRQEV